MTTDSVFSKSVWMATLAIASVGMLANQGFGQELNGASGADQEIDRPSDDAGEFQLLKELLRRIDEYIARAEKPEDDKAAYGQASRLTTEVVKNYVRSKEYDQTIVLREFDQEAIPHEFAYLRNHFIYVYLDIRDVEALTRLLAVNCPVDRMGLGQSIESTLVIRSSEATDGKEVLVLCDAWRMAKSKGNQMHLVGALRRGFEPMGIVAKDDAEYVNKVRKWMAESREAYEPNPDYPFKYHILAFQGKPLPLFVPKGSVEKWDGKTNYPEVEDLPERPRIWKLSR